MKLRPIDPPNLPVAANRRYLEALDCVQKGKHLLRSQTDPVTWGLAEILKSRHGEKRGNREQTVASFDNDLVRAVEIHESENGSVRMQLQAHLLTGLAYEEIGERLKESARTVELFALCFFDVRGNMSDQTKKELVDAYKNVPPDRLMPDFIWKLAALVGGIEALEEAMLTAAVRNLQDAATVSAVEAKSIAHHKIAEAIKAFDIDEPNSVRELRQMLDSLKDVQPNDANENLLEQIGAIFTSMPLTVGQSDPEMTPPEMMEFELSAAELNVDEHLRVGFGQELDNKQELLDMRFPDGPDDDAALSIPQQPREEAAADGAGTNTDTVDPVFRQADEGAATEPQPQRITPAVELGFKLKRIKRENASRVPPVQSTASPVQSIASKASPVLSIADKIAAVIAAQANESLSEEEMRRLDREWEDFARNTAGAIRNRRWKAFLEKHPGYIQKEARERIKAFAKLKSEEEQGSDPS